MKKVYKKALAFDLGGTKIAAAVVNERGKIIEFVKEKVDTSKGVVSLVAQFHRLGAPLIQTHKVKQAVIASAGPLDPFAGKLLNPTNLKKQGKLLGVVPLAQLVQKKLKIKTRLENDAASAVLAEYWIGKGKGAKNIMAITLGTGLGVGVIANNQLLRSGRNLHTEAGHITIDYQDTQWQCGCGNFGCAEAFLSGVNFTKRMNQVYFQNPIDGEELVHRARLGDARVIAEFIHYGERLAAFLYSQIVVFSPERIIISGGFSHSSDLFLSVTEKKLTDLLSTRRVGIDMLPKILLSDFKDEAGLLGAAYTAFHSN